MMVPYKAIYWNVLSPLVRRSITKRYSDTLASYAIKNGKKHYRELLQRADDIGPGNPMAADFYGACVFIACWLGTGKLISPAGMEKVTEDVMRTMKPFFALQNLNTKRGSGYWYRFMKKYEAWSADKFDRYPTIWKVHFDENLHRDGSYFYFTQCPICTLCQKEGIPEILPALCRTDEIMFHMQHGVLHRKHTLAAGDKICDYWVVGDKVKDPR